MRRGMLLLFVIIAALAASVFAAKFTVKQDGTGDFIAIQEAIDPAQEGDTITVYPGTYYENIHFDGKNIVLRSTDPEDWDVVEATVIDGDRKGRCVDLTDTTGDSVLSGFTITNGRIRGAGGGVYGGSGLHGAPRANASITYCIITENEARGLFGGGGVWSCDGLIKNCIITHNDATEPPEDGAAVGGGLCSCSGLIENCVIAHNSAFYGGGLALCNGTISNCVIADNAIPGSIGTGMMSCYGEITNCIIWGNHSWHGFDSNQLYWTSAPSYSCLKVKPEGGKGNIIQDPLFAAGTYGDYYLHPDSPCINAGSMSAEDAGLSDRTTQIDGTPDSGVVDMGFHYPIPSVSIGPEIFCSLNAEEFAPGDLMQGYLAIDNAGVEATVDVYAGFILPDGTFYSWTDEGLTLGLWPWVVDWVLTSGFSFGPELAFQLNLPQVDPGSYTYAAALAESGGTGLEFTSMGSIEFEIIEAMPVPGYHVDGESGDDSNDGSQYAPWKTITHALTSIEGSETDPVTIHVAAGTYSASTNGEAFPLNMKSWVSLIGEGAESTILDAEQGACHVIFCSGVNGLRISGFTITGGFSSGHAGGISCEDSSPTIHNNIICGNIGYWGGGIDCYGGSPTIRDNTITGNLAICGGGIDCLQSAAVIYNNTITDNFAYWDGGGGIACEDSSCIIEDNAIIGNSAELWNGGGIYCDLSASPMIVNNLIADNCAEDDGGGIYCCQGSSAIIQNNTIIHNSANGGAGGIDCFGSSPTITDCIIWDNGDDLGGCSATFCCIEDDDPGEGNISDDPLFVPGPFGDYYLHPDSPCIDAGSQSASAAGLSDRTTQTDGTPDTGIVDMGYHYPLP
ncbi:right-handed parallel beta-helix repeat-containing protein [bacterium]|nr:right-handed parallel beta-helix repeat-containing protein [bacterium]